MYSYSIPMYYSNTISKLLEPTLYLIFSIYLFLNNAYGTIILQASPSKYLIEHESVKNYKHCVMPSSFLPASKYLIKHELVENYKRCIMMDTLLIVVQTNMCKE